MVFALAAAVSRSRRSGVAVGDTLAVARPSEVDRLRQEERELVGS